MISTWKEIVGSGIALVLVAIGLMQLPMFKTERQKQDELLTPDQRKRAATMETFCRGGTPVGLDQPIASYHRDMACRGRELIVGQATVRANPKWQQELALEVKKATDQHRECERNVRRMQLEKEAVRLRGEDQSPDWRSRYEVMRPRLQHGGFFRQLEVRQRCAGTISAAIAGRRDPRQVSNSSAQRPRGPEYSCTQGPLLKSGGGLKLPLPAAMPRS